MTEHTNKAPRISRALGVLLAAALAACSGGGSTEHTDHGGAAAGTTLMAGRAVDGPLQGATACLDLDDDGACGSGEPASTATDAQGRWTLRVPAGQAALHRVVVEVPATAIDADTGAAVGTAFTLAAPAGGDVANVFVSPLTTLVQAHMDATGASRDEAAALVQAQAGLLATPLVDFGSDAATSRVARLAQLTALRQMIDLASLVGTTDRTGSVITAAEVARQVRAGLLAQLPAVAAAAADPVLAATSGAALQATLQATARMLAGESAVTAATVRAGATARRLASEPPFTQGEPTATLTALSFTDDNNWFMRSLQSSGTDTVADSNGYVRYYDVKQQSSGNAFTGFGITRGWATGVPQDRSGDVHWSGTAWAGCPLGDRFISKLRDAEGRSRYDYCHGRSQGTTVRRVVDISGQRLVDIVRDTIRSFPNGSSGVSYAQWGPVGPNGNGLERLGTDTFPTGSQIFYQTQTITGTAPAYDVRASNVVLAFNAAVSAGGDARATPSLACNVAAQTAASAQVEVTSLELLISRMGGKPCIYNQGGSAPNLSLNPDEWWGNSTVNLGDVTGANTLPANTGNFYNTTASVRVSFAATGNGVTFYNCYRRPNGVGGPRNCSIIGAGTYAIQTLGDARVLTFSTMPARAQRLTYVRLFVERGGKVYYGYRDPLGSVDLDLRLNMQAANAVLRKLGLPPLMPVTPPGQATGDRAATLSTLKGVWGGTDTNDTQAFVLRFGDNGRVLLAEAKPYLPTTRELAGFELGWIDWDPATKHVSGLLEVDTNLTSGLSHPRPEDAPVIVTADQIVGDGGPIGRLATDNAGLVGLWARESTTDLSVQHLAFFASGRFMLIDTVGGQDGSCNPTNTVAAQSGPPGVEYGRYTWDPVAGTLRAFGVLYDTNGCSGIFDSLASPPVTEDTVPLRLAADRRSFTVPDNNNTGVQTWYRIDPR